MTTTTCRSCGAPILWARTPSESTMPLDAGGDPAGLVVLGPHRTAHGTPMIDRIESPGAPSMLMDGEERYTSHFATCPNAEEHRRR